GPGSGIGFRTKPVCSKPSIANAFMVFAFSSTGGRLLRTSVTDVVSAVESAEALHIPFPSCDRTQTRNHRVLAVRRIGKPLAVVSAVDAELVLNVERPGRMR